MAAARGAERSGAAAQPPQRLEDFEARHGCRAGLYAPHLERDLRVWNASTSLGYPVTRAYLEQLFESRPCLLRVLVHGRRAYVRRGTRPCTNSIENALLHVGRLLAFLLASGVEVPDVEFLLNVRDRPSAPHEPAPIFTTWTTSAHGDIPFLDPRRLDEALDGCRQVNGPAPPSFEDRRELLFFRGALSGAVAEAPMRTESFALFPRARLMLLAERHPDLIDAGLTPGNPEGGMSAELQKDPEFVAFWRKHRKPFVPQHEWTRYRYHAVLDGVSGASRLACSLLSGSVVFKQSSPFYSWFERWVQPSVHYVPVPPDLSELPSLVLWARERPEAMGRMAEAAAARMREVFRPEVMLCYLARLLAAYRAVLGFAPAAPAAHEGWRPLPPAESEPSAAGPGAGGAAAASREPPPVGPEASPHKGRPAARQSNECTSLLIAGETEDGLRCYSQHHDRSRKPGGGTGDFETTWLKLRHDTEMLEHLGEGRLRRRFRGAPALFRKILTAADAYRRRPTQSFSMQMPDEKERELWRMVHNRNVYTPPAAKRPLAAVVNPRLDFGAIEDLYFSRAANVSADAKCLGADAGGWVVVDDLFEPAALEALRSYLTESTFYYFPKFGGHYLSSLLEDGMAAPILAQVARELQRRFPRILGRHPLRTAWAFKFDNALNDTASAPGKQLGVGVHADSAAVNLNFWPIEAGAGDSGGMVLYKVGAPPEMQFQEFNDPKHLRSIAETAAREEIGYRANRLVIFNSNLLHETGRLHFPPGYLRRRINLTLLFGKRCER